MIRHVSSTDGRQLNRNERRKLRTRKQLIEATTELLIETSFDELTILKITDRADVARATFYIYFKDKEEAVWAILQESFAELVEGQRRIDFDDPKRYRFAKWIRLFEYVVEHHDLLQVLMSERGHIKLKQMVATFMASTVEEDLRAERVERTTELSFEFESNFYAGAVMQTVTWWLQDIEAYTPVEIAEMVYRIVLREEPPVL